MMKNDSFSHPLMKNNISRGDLDVLIEFLNQRDPMLTQASNVEAFEREWSEWLNVNYSVYVNSGSSANLITMAVLRQLLGAGEIVLPPLTWVSDVAAVIQNGFDPVFADINPKTLCMDDEQVLKKVTEKTRAVFMTHVQGFNGLSHRLLHLLKEKKVPLVEDVCESHGATFDGKRLGSFGLVSNFSFYYAHHMSTIEGGMVCTNDAKIYHLIRMFRSHGLVREAGNKELRERYRKDYPSLNPEFIFAFPAYNVRNTEIGAVIGRNQLKRLNENNRKRNRNLSLYLDCLNDQRFRTDFIFEGCSNYAFPLVLKKPDFDLRDRLEGHMRKHSIEFRRGNAGGGNQMRQPYLEKIIENQEWEEYPEVEHIHHFGWYIGNYPDLKEEDISTLCELLNSA